MARELITISRLFSSRRVVFGLAPRTGGFGSNEATQRRRRVGHSHQLLPVLAIPALSGRDLPDERGAACSHAAPLIADLGELTFATRGSGSDFQTVGAHGVHPASADIVAAIPELAGRPSGCAKSARVVQAGSATAVLVRDPPIARELSPTAPRWPESPMPLAA